MGRTKDTQRALLKALEKTPKSRRELEEDFQGEHSKIKSALKKLIARGELKKEGKKYSRVVIEYDRKSSASKGVSPVSEIISVPIAMQMRKDASKVKKKSVKIVEPEVDLDEEIRRLEQELEGSDSSDEESESDDSDVGQTKVLSLSKFADDHVQHLPDNCLPEPGRYHPSRDGMKSTKAKKKQPNLTKEIEDKERSSGLKQAVQEVLSGYKARSSERLPFYCRVCAKQYDNEIDFFSHKNTEFHKVAVETERKATYCRLCRKQLTSPEQMKEHLRSKPHREKLQNMRNRQQGSRNQQNRGNRQWV